MAMSEISRTIMVNLQIVFVAFSVISAPAYGNVIQNGSFETGDFTNWTLFTTANGSLGLNPLPMVASFDIFGTGPNRLLKNNGSQP